MIGLILSLALAGQGNPQQIEKRIDSLRGLPDARRAVETKSLALEIRALPDGKDKVNLASVLSNLSTEGDFGRDTLQDVTTTLAKAVQASPPAPMPGETIPFAYTELAALAKYEHMRVDLDAPQYRRAQQALDALDAKRAQVDFRLTDIHGKSWKLSDQRGSYVLVNFWATWCPPCRKEMPDIEWLSKKFAGRLVVLAISDETADKVDPLIAKGGYTYPILLDPGRTVNTLYGVDGIPKSFLYDPKGHLVGQTIDMRTRAQFLDLLARAGLKA